MRKSQAVDWPGRISQALGKLQVHPGMESEGAAASASWTSSPSAPPRLSDAL